MFTSIYIYAHTYIYICVINTLICSVPDLLCTTNSVNLVRSRKVLLTLIHFERDRTSLAATSDLAGVQVRHFVSGLSAYGAGYATKSTRR